MYRKRFGLTAHPLPKDAHGRTLFADSPGLRLLERRFEQLLADRGLGVLTAEPGVGKTAGIRELCARLPEPDHRVIYFCNTAVSPLDLYRSIAVDLGVRPSHRRAELWTSIKKTLVHMVDERGTTPVLVIDQAHYLADAFLADLSSFLNFAFDSRDLLTLWLVGLPPLAARLRMQQHRELDMRVHAYVHLEPYPRDTFIALVDHALKAAGAQTKLLSDPALELLFRASRGVPRVAAKLLRSALRLAHERDQNFVDDALMEAAVDQHLPAAAVAA